MGEALQTLVHWLRRRVADWQRLGELLDQQRGRASETYPDAVELVERFRSLGRDLSLARALMPGSSLYRELENLFLKAHEAVFRRPSQHRAQLVELFRDEVPRVYNDMRGTIWITDFGLAKAGDQQSLTSHHRTRLLQARSAAMFDFGTASLPSPTMWGWRISNCSWWGRLISRP